MKKQYDGVDAAKLILSLFVVAIHAHLFNGILYPTLRIAVPVFFIFTGFFTFSKINAANSPAEKKSILWNIEKRYLLLYLFWFVVLLPITMHYRKYYIHGITGGLMHIFRDLIWDSTFRASWYLMACILGIALIYFLSNKSPFVLISLGLFSYVFATFCSKYQILIYNNTALNMIFSAINRYISDPYQNVFISIMYITLGKLIAEQKLKIFNKTRSIIGFIICYLGLLCEFHFAKNEIWFNLSCDCWFFLAPTALFFALFLLNLRIRLPKAPVMRSLSTIIYCSHLSIMLIVSKMLSILGIADTYKILLFVITLICTLILSLMILRLEKNNRFRILRFSH